MKTNIKGAVSWQHSPICLVFPIPPPYLLWNLTLAKKLLVDDKITASWQKKICVLSVILKFTNNRDELWKLFSLTVFQKPQLQSMLIFLNLAHLCLLLYLLCYLNLSSMFQAVTFMLCLIWRPEFFRISWHSSFKSLTIRLAKKC